MSNVAKYNDGELATSHQLKVRIKGGNLEGWKEKRLYFSWKIEDIKIIDKDSPDEIIISSKNQEDARLYISGEFFAYLEKFIPAQSFIHGIFEVKFKNLVVFLGIAVLLSFFVSSAFEGVVSGMVKNVPSFIEESLAEMVIKQLDVESTKCENEAGIKGLEKMVRHLKMKLDVDLKLDLYVIEESIPNAMAGPGNIMIIHSGLISKADNQDEVLGVIAHELGHIYHNHPTEGLVRGIGISVLFSAVLGGDLSIISDLGSLVAILGYGRVAEEEADEFAKDTLKKANVGTAGLVKFFKKMQKEDGIGENIPDYFSTHPNTASRIRNLQINGGVTEKTAILSDKEWNDVKAVCDKKIVIPTVE